MCVDLLPIRAIFCSDPDLDPTRGLDPLSVFFGSGSQSRRRSLGSEGIRIHNTALTYNITFVLKKS